MTCITFGVLMHPPTLTPVSVFHSPSVQSNIYHIHVIRALGAPGEDVWARVAVESIGEAAHHALFYELPLLHVN